MLLQQAAGETASAIVELRELADGIRPTTLTRRGLRSAVCAGFAAGGNLVSRDGTGSPGGRDVATAGGTSWSYVSRSAA